MSTNRKFVQFATTALLTAIGTILVGLLFFGYAIFKPDSSAFQFVALGVVGGMVFSTFRFLSKSQATISITLLFVLDMLLQRSTIWKFMMRDVLYFFGFTIALFIFTNYYFDKLRGIIAGGVIALSSIIAASYIVITVVLYIVFSFSSNGFGFNLPQMIYFNLAQGFLIGLGLGIGIEAAEIVLKRVP